MEVYNTKPRGGIVTNIKPGNGAVLNVFPKISRVYGEESRFNMMGRGMPIGLLLTITYPEAFRI
jgi:hypothetical protein